MENNPTETMIAFIRQIGLKVSLEGIPGKTFVPGILIRNGGLVIDKSRLTYPGDMLHEAGHLAVMPAAIRKTMNDDLGNDPIHQGGELMAIAWSYAACVHLEIDPHIVFHEHGYKGGGAEIVENFNAGRYFGVPLLQWYGMTKERPQLPADITFPKMLCWLNPKPD
jgi:hypothetical protein